MPPKLAHIDCWIFDLDLTLYRPEANIMAQIRDRIALYVERYFQIDSDAAHHIRTTYWKQYGTTLGGLIAEHGVDPHSYLDFVHDVDMTKLSPAPELAAHIAALPGRKLIFTNADAPYAQRVLAKLGLAHAFEDIFDIHRMEHTPKPALESYHAMCKALDVDPKSAVFIEDSAHNLSPAKQLGMTTIWVNNEAQSGSSGHESDIDLEITDVAQWLRALHQQKVTL
jgi:putative hydrolase of the HAD superfamily